MAQKQLYALYFLLVFTLNGAFGNSKSGDTLTCEILSTKRASIECWLKKVEMWQRQLDKADSSLLVLKRIGKFTQNPAYNQLEANRLYTLAQIYLKKIHYDSSYYYAKAAAEKFILQKKFEEASSAYNLAGAAMKRKGEPDLAIQLFYKSLEIADKSGLEMRKAWAYMNLSDAYRKLEEYDKTRGFLLKSYQIAEKHNNALLISVTSSDLATIYLDHAMLDSAYYFAQNALKYLANNNNPHLKACTALIFAIYANAEGRKSDAANHYKEILENESIAQHEKAFFLYHYGAALNKGKQYREAIPAYEEALTLAKQAGDKSLYHSILQDYYFLPALVNDYKKSYELTNEYLILNDSIRNKEKADKIQELTIKYESTEKERELQASKLEIAERTIQRNLFLGGFISFSIIGILFIIWLRQRVRLGQRLRAQDAAIAQQQITNLEQQQKYISLQAMMAGEEAERNRLGKELHDGLGGMMSNLKLTLTTRSKCMDDDTVQDSIKIIDKASSELRRIAQNMMPESLAKFGLITAIEDLCDEVEHHAKIKTDFQYFGMVESLPDTIVLPVYRIIQELINNIIKHSQATDVTVQLIQQDKMLYLTMEDNGKGLCVEEALEKGGQGLKNIESRVAFLNGNFMIESTPNAGTSVNIEIPMP